MSLELFNEPTSISRRFSREFLGKALELAHLYGWKPMGTCPPSSLDFHILNVEWSGVYLTNDGQIVSAEDAHSLACALEKSLDDIPDENIEMDWNLEYWVEYELPEWLSPEERELLEDGLDEHSPSYAKVHPFVFFAGDEKQQLIHFMRFCRLGSFIVL